MRPISPRVTRIAGVVALAALLACGTAMASFGEGPGGGPGRGRGVRAILDKLDLSAEQRDRIEALGETSRAAMKEARARVKAERAAVRAALDAANPDAAAIGNAMLKVKASREAVRAERKKLHDATLSVLTPDQRVRFETFIDAMKMVRQARRDRPHR